jgi:alpha-ketoglutaric semialdehyde dehydrogenase
MMDEGRLDKFAFTGSTAVGRVIGEVAGRNLLHPRWSSAARTRWS